MRVSIGRRRAISEVLGTVMVAAMTIIAGAAIFGYVNGQAGAASQAYGSQVGNSIQYLEEKFAVVDLGISNVTCGSSTCSSFTIWIYNTGRIQLNLLQIRLYDPSSPSKWNMNLLFNYSTIGGTSTNRVHDLATGSSHCDLTITTTYLNPLLTGSGSFSAATSYTATVQLTVPPTSATPVGATCPSFGQLAHTNTYFVDVVGLYGNSVVYSQKG